MAKLKEQQKQNSPTSEISEPKIEKVEDDQEGEVDEVDKVDEKPMNEVKKSPETDQNAQRVLMEIEMLQNDGRYRVELLHQLQELNKALVVVAEVLVNLSGNGK